MYFVTIPGVGIHPNKARSLVHSHAFFGGVHVCVCVCVYLLVCVPVSVRPRERRVRCCSPPVVRVFPDAKPRIRNESETMKKKNDTSKKRYSKQGKELNPPPANSSLQPRRGGTPIHSLVRVCACACVYIGTRQPWQQHVRRVLCSTEASMCAPGTSTWQEKRRFRKKQKHCRTSSKSEGFASVFSFLLTCSTPQKKKRPPDNRTKKKEREKRSAYDVCRYECRMGLWKARTKKGGKTHTPAQHSLWKWNKKKKNRAIHRHIHCTWLFNHTNRADSSSLSTMPFSSSFFPSSWNFSLPYSLFFFFF